MDVTEKCGLFLPAYDFATWHTYVNANFQVIDGLLAGALGVDAVEGLWKPGTSYTLGMIVVDGETSNLYDCIKAHTSGNVSLQTDLAAHPDWWSQRVPGLPVFRGSWQPNTLYQSGDFVIYGHKYAAVAKQHTSAAVFDTDVSNGNLILIIDLSPSVALAVSSAAAAQAAAEAAQLAAASAVSTARVSISELAPSPPVDNQLWFNPVTGLLAVRYNDGNSAQWVGVGDAVGTAIGENELDNGDFTFSDYGSGPVTHTPGSANIVPCCNRWQSQTPTGTTHIITATRLSAGDAPLVQSSILYAQRSQVTLSTTGPYIKQRGNIPTRYLGKRMTLGGWFNSSVAQASINLYFYLKLNASLQIANIADPNQPATVILGKNIVIPVANQWVFIAVPFQCRLPASGDNIAPDGTARWDMALRFDTPATYDYTGLKLEVGGQSTAFRIMNEAEMRLRLARYRRDGKLRLSGRSASSTTHRIQVPSGQSGMRTSPVVSSTTDVATNATAVAVTADQRNVQLQFTGPATDNAFDCQVSYVLDAEDYS